MSNIISALEIPLILEGIASRLDRQDYAICTLVNRDFYELFTPLLWRRLVIENPEPLSELDFEASQEQALSNNVQWVRSLSIDTTCHQGMFRTLRSSCNGLRNVELQMTRKDDWDESSLLKVLPLVSSNKNLRTCSIRSYTDFSRGAIMQLTKAISASSRLTVLDLKLATRPRLGWLENILQNLPRTLKSLHLQRGRMRATDEVEHIPTEGWPQSYPYLEIVTMVIKVTLLEEVAFIEFLKRCPSLKEFSAPQMAVTQTITKLADLLKDDMQHPSLDTLDLCYVDEITERQWENLVMGMKDRIKVFSTRLAFNTPTTYLNIQNMTTSWSYSLETLKIEKPDRITSQDIQRILTTCVKLKRFDCMCQWLVNSVKALGIGLEVLPGLKAIHGRKPNSEDSVDNANMDEMADWVCLDLEELKLTFADGRSETAEETESSEQEQWTIQGIKRVYQQLGRLKKLKELTIGWCSVTTFSKNAGLDMSFQSGLEHMIGLESLRMIDITYIAKVKIDKAELEWMVDNWRALKQIVGLRYRYRIFGENVEEPAYITSMSSQQPGLVIT